MFDNCTVLNKLICVSVQLLRKNGGNNFLSHDRILLIALNRPTINTYTGKHTKACYY